MPMMPVSVIVNVVMPHYSLRVLFSSIRNLVDVVVAVSVIRRSAASPARAKLLNKACSKTGATPSDSLSDKRTLLWGGRGHPVGLYAPLQ